MQDTGWLVRYPGHRAAKRGLVGIQYTGYRSLGRAGGYNLPDTGLHIYCSKVGLGGTVCRIQGYWASGMVWVGKW